MKNKKWLLGVGVILLVILFGEISTALTGGRRDTENAVQNEMVSEFQRESQTEQ